MTSCQGQVFLETNILGEIQISPSLLGLRAYRYTRWALILALIEADLRPRPGRNCCGAAHAVLASYLLRTFRGMVTGRAGTTRDTTLAYFYSVLASRRHRGAGAAA